MTRNGRLQYGTVSKRGKRNKVWIGRWREEVPGPQGSVRIVRKSVVLGAVEDMSSKRDAERVLWERLQLLNVGKEGSSGPMTLRRFAEEVWKPSVFPSVKFSTRLFYDHNLKTHILPVFVEVPLRSLTRDGIQKWLNGKVQRRHVLELGPSPQDHLWDGAQRCGDGRTGPAECRQKDPSAASYSYRGAAVGLPG
jgi:hypothetical protein